MSKIIILQSGDSVSLDPTQSGFAHGFGIFETIKLAGRQLCFWDAHWARMVASAQTLRLELDVSQAEAFRAIRSLVQAEGLYDGVIKLSLVRASAGTQCYVYARPKLGIGGCARLQLNNDVPLNETSLLAGHKTHNYMENMLMLEAARASGFTDVIRLNVAGQLTETTVGNVFFIQGETLYTPALATGILPGVVRAMLVEAAQLLGIEVVEGAFSSSLLQVMDAAFVSNSLLGMQAVEMVSVDGLERTLRSLENPMVVDLTEALEVVEAASAVDVG